MAAEDNRWDESRQVWVDGATGNYMRPTDRGGDGRWYSPDGRMVYDDATGQWSSVSAGDGSSTALRTNPGYMYDMQERDHAFQLERDRINQEFTAKEAALDRAMRQQEMETNRKLEIELAEKRINAEQYMQQRSLAQQESQFARELAQRQLEADRDFQIQQADIKIRQMAEGRMERELQARLAANPQDLVAYEFYKRGLGQPEAWDDAQGQATGMGSGQGTGQTPNAIGTPYEEAPPAYSDQSLQELLSSLYSNVGQGALYNPNLSGQTVFGAQIQSPNSISRAEGVNLSDTEMGILSSFLRAGIDMGGGRRVALDPNDYFQQVEQSWVPTLSSAGSQQTQYL